MNEELMDDRCCVTCKRGDLVQDNEQGEMVHCKPKDEYVPTDHICTDYED